MPNCWSRPRCAGPREHVLVRVRRERVQVEEQVVRMLMSSHRACSGWNSMPRGSRRRGGGEVVDGQVVDPPFFASSHRTCIVDPVRRVRRRRLLVEVGAVDAVGHPLHRERPPLEVRQQQVRDVEVVGDQIALRVPLVGPEDLVEVGEPELPLGQLDPPCVALAFTGLERPRELNREGRAARTACSLRHANDGNRSRLLRLSRSWIHGAAWIAWSTNGRTSPRSLRSPRRPSASRSSSNSTIGGSSPRSAPPRATGRRPKR